MDSINKRSWPSGLISGLYADDPGSALSEDKNFFFLLLFFFFFFFCTLTTWMRVFSQINNCQQKKKQTNKQTKQKGGLRF